MFTRLIHFLLSLVIFLPACTTPVQTAMPTVEASETATLSVVSEKTYTPQPENTPRPTSTNVPLQLQKIGTFREDCMEKESGLPEDGLVEVAHLPSGLCFHGELDMFETNGHDYVAQVILRNFSQSEEAFRIVDVTDARQPVTVGAWKWNVPTYSSDIKAFRQGDRWFLALSRDPNLTRNPNVSEITRATLCSSTGGIAIIEVTDPADPRLLTILTGESTRSRKKWCNSHTAEISRGPDGNGAYLYVSALDVFDLRVLDIRDLANVTEVGFYTHPDAGVYNERNVFFVHDTTIVGDRVYVSYWKSGLIILNRQDLEAGKRVTPLNPLDSIAPWGLNIHHAFPTTDEDFVFVEDEAPFKEPESRLRLYDIRDLKNPREVAAITLPDSFGAPHNLLVADDLLFVGWYQDGVRVFKYDTSNPESPIIEPYAFKSVRSKKTLNPTSRAFDGIWGVRLHDCTVADQPRTCIYASDISWGLLILALENQP